MKHEKKKLEDGFALCGLSLGVKLVEQMCFHFRFKGFDGRWQKWKEGEFRTTITL